MKSIIFITAIAFLTITSLFSSVKTEFKRNPLSIIDTCEGKVKLTLIRTWGGDETEDENQFFRFPMDIKIGKDGKTVYIADSANHRIQVFDHKGHFVKTIGRKGRGPDDLYEPSSLSFDKFNNLIVCENGNYRIQVFDSKGKSSDIIRFGNNKPSSIAVNQQNEIVFYSYLKSSISKKMLYILNWEGKPIREIGMLHKKSLSNPEYKSESIFFALGSDDSIFILYYATPYFRKYSSKGDSLMIVTFDISPDIPAIKWDGTSGSPADPGKYSTQISAGLALDHQERIYIVAATRPKKKSERFFLTSEGRFPKKIESENTDRFRLLVFNSSGKIIAAKKMDVFCDNIYVHGDRLFIIDTYMGQVIYEYKVSFN